MSLLTTLQKAGKGTGTAVESLKKRKAEERKNAVVAQETVVRVLGPAIPEPRTKNPLLQGLEKILKKK